MSSPFITLPYRIDRTPPEFIGEGLQSPDSLVEYLLKNFSKRGDKVFDPFAGVGTTLFAAEKLGRVPFGVEADPRLQQWVAGQMEHWMNLRPGDAYKVAAMGFPKMDLCITCPPYMRKNEKWNPLSGGDPARAGYDVYLRRMRQVFKALSGVMKRGAAVIVQADNLAGRVYTPLVSDLIRAISPVMKLENEIVVAYRGGDVTHTQCLVFRNVTP